MRQRFIVLLCLSLLTGCDDTQIKGGKSKRGDKPHLVELITVEKTPLEARRILTGTLEALHSVQIHAQEQGKIQEIPYYPGDRVEQGTLLVKIDDSLLEAELRKATAAYDQTKLDLKRLNKLAPRKLASEEELAKAETAVEQARAEKDLLSTRLSHTAIHAPFNAVVSERLKEPGDIVAIQGHIMTLFDPDTLIVKLHISEILLSNISLGQNVNVRIDALGDQTFEGKVTRIYPTIDSVTRQGTIEVTLDPVPSGALPGQLVRIGITAKTSPVKSIPFTVIRHDTRGEYVYRVDKDDIARYTPVQTGTQIGNNVEIIEGLEIGDRIVSRGLLGIRDGKKVTTVKNNIPQTAAPPDKK